MTQTIEQSTAELVARYVNAWNETDPEARRGAVSALWKANGAEFVEGTAFRGHDGAVADDFMSRVKKALESWEASVV